MSVTIAGAGTAADVQLIAGDDTLGGLLAGGAILIDIIQADPAVLGTAPVSALFQDLHAGAGLQSADTLAVSGRIGADVQLGSGNDTLKLNGGAAVAGVGLIVLILIGIVVGCGGAAGIAGGHIVHQDPALVVLPQPFLVSRMVTTSPLL